MEGGGRGRLYTYRATLSPPEYDSCIKMGSDESHFNVSAGSDGQNHKTVSTNHNLSEEKGEPKAVSNRGPSAYESNALPLTRPSWLTCKAMDLYTYTYIYGCNTTTGRGHGLT